MKIYIRTARTVKELLEAINSESFKDATVEVDSSYSSTNVEIWHDDCTNTVILK
jgi:hypothetical protein